MTTAFITQILTGYEDFISFVLSANTNNSLYQKLRSTFLSTREKITYCQNIWNADRVM